MVSLISEIKAFVARLPNVVEGNNEGKLAYEVGKRLFLIIDEEKAEIIVKAHPKKRKDLLELSTIKAGEDDLLIVDIQKYSSAKMLNELVIDSFHLVANKKALQKLYTQFPQ